MTSELRPCPWCGAKPFEEDGLLECQTYQCPTKHEWYPQTWNSAWCWQEIDRLKRERDAYREVAISIDQDLPGTVSINHSRKRVDAEAKWILGGK